MKNINVFANEVLSQNDYFWSACGLDDLYPITYSSQGEFLLDRAQKLNTCKFARNHHTFSKEIRYGNLRCGGDVYSEDENGNPVYDFSYINGVYKKLLSYGVKPIVEMDFLPDELVGNKGNIYLENTNERHTNRHYPNDWDKWTKLLKAFMQNLVSEFGIEELRTWYFEVWNEPDHWAIDKWELFYKLYDVFVDAVKSTDEKLRVGGPGCFRQHFLFSFLNHVANGTNYVTGKKGTPIDFVSFHVYGTSGAWLKNYPLNLPTVQRFSHEFCWLKTMLDNHPALKDVEFHLNEWGVSSHYEKKVGDFPPLEIRNSEFSALFFTKLVDTALTHRHVNSFNIKMLLYWGYANEDFFDTMFNGNRSLTTKGNVCKPIQTAHELLSMLGKNFVKTDLIAGGDEGVIATSDESGAKAIIYYFNEYDEKQQLLDRDYLVNFNGLENGKYLLKVYTLDNFNNNTYRLWQRLGCPENPTDKQLELLHKEQDIKASLVQEIQVSNNAFAYKTTLSSISMKLIALEKI